jgi:membrane protease YdiL (CAAX protease family)
VETTPTPAGRPLEAPHATGLLVVLLATLPLSLVGARSLLAGALVTQLALLLVTLRWARRTGFVPGRLLRLTLPPKGALLLGGGIGVAGILAGAGLHSLTRAASPRRLVELFDVGRLLMNTGLSQAVLLAVISLLPAVCEEVAFRGGLQSALGWRRSPARSIAISALVFAVFHLDPIRFPGVLMLGGAFGWLTWRTGSIWPSMVAHAVNNGTAVLGLALASHGAAGQAESVGPGEAAALLAAGLVLYALLVAGARRGLPPAPGAASFLVPRDPGSGLDGPGGAGAAGPASGAATTAGAAPSP